MRVRGDLLSEFISSWQERGWDVIALNSRRCREMLEGLNESSLRALVDTAQGGSVAAVA